MKLDVQESKLNIKLPHDLFSAIGEIVVIYSAIEHEIKHIIYTLLRISPPEGRVAINTPDTSRNLETIKKLLILNDIEPPPNFTKLKSETNDLAEIRNWLSHGVWTIVDNAHQLQITHADPWSPDGKNKVNRKIVPSIHEIESSQIISVAKSGAELLDYIIDLHVEIQEQLPKSF